jgi:hypothetical protein
MSAAGRIESFHSRRKFEPMIDGSLSVILSYNALVDS